MKKRYAVIIIVLLLLASLGGNPAAAWASDLPEGWEHFENFTGQTDISGIQLANLSPDLTMEQMFYYVNKMMMEQRGRYGVDYLSFSFAFNLQLSGSAAADFFERLVLAADAICPPRGVVENIRCATATSVAGYYFLLCEVNGTTLEDEAALYYAKIQEIVAEARLAASTPRGQLAYLNQYLVDTVEYIEGPRAFSALGAVLDGQAVCDGYTYAMLDFCRLLGIPAVKINSEDHSWNGVYLDGDWKMLDVTWNDTSQDSNRYFLVDSIADPTGQHDYDRKLVELAKRLALQTHEHEQALRYVQQQGIFQGDANGNLNLTNSLTRAELATLLVRLNGAAAEVNAVPERYAALCTFTDVPEWAQPMVGYCVEQGLLTGYSEQAYGAADAVTPQAACTVILRYLGEAETDWSYDTACSKAAQLGLVSPYYPTGTKALRNDMVDLIYAALMR